MPQDLQHLDCIQLAQNPGSVLKFHIYVFNILIRHINKICEGLLESAQCKILM